MRKCCGTPVDVITIVAISLLGIAQGLPQGEKCMTPLGNNGTCILIRDCTDLSSQLWHKPVSNFTLDLLRKSICGFEGIDPLVCCPLTTSSKKTTDDPWATPKAEITEDVSQHKNLDLLPVNICGPYDPEKYDRIYNTHGNKTNVFEFPWVALLKYTDVHGTPFKCGGSIINENYILTAAHCVTNLPKGLRLISARIGEHDFDSEIDCIKDHNGGKKCAPPPRDIDIEERIFHPQYSGWPNFENDIALVRLSRSLKFSTDSVKPICLPMELPQQTEDFTGKYLIITGWTVTDDVNLSPALLMSRVQGTPFPYCSSAFRKIVPISPSNHICAGTVNESSCLGDSGGPLIYVTRMTHSLRNVQVGIMSFGTRKCGDPGKPAVYTRVGHYMKWILDNMKP